MLDTSEQQPVQETKGHFLKKFFRLLTIWDGIWSIPIAIFLFIASGYLIVHLYGPEAGSMLPVYLQRLFYAAICMVICNFIALFGLYMNFRGIFKYYLNQSTKEFKELPPKVKIILLLSLYFLYFVFFAAFLILV